MTTEAQKRAQARYDAKRPTPVPVRLNAEEMAWLDAKRLPGEGRGPALKRLASVSKSQSLTVETEMNKTATEKLTELCGNGYCEYATHPLEEDGEVVKTRGWWWRQTPDGKPFGPSFKAQFIGRDFGEASEYFLVRR
jgi:hypothetical protein